VNKKIVVLQMEKLERIKKFTMLQRETDKPREGIYPCAITLNRCLDPHPTKRPQGVHVTGGTVFK
jgi:hypothetical protein